MILPWIACTPPEPLLPSEPSGGTLTDSAVDPIPPAPGVPIVTFPAGPPANLLVITLDTTRRDAIGRYGGTGLTPNLDRVLAEAVVLDDHRTCANWTGPSMSCLLTGNTPFEQGWWPWSSDPEIPGSLAELPTLAHLLGDEFLTVVVTANEVFGWDLNLMRGFQIVDNPEFEPADVVTDIAVGRAETLARQLLPWHLHVHYVDPHSTYCPPDGYVDPERYVDLGVRECPNASTLFERVYPERDADWQRQFADNLRALYEGELAFWDAEFGRLWAALDEAGALDDTLVVFATDHGEQLIERGLLGHGHTLGSEENRAVAAFWARGLAPVAWDGPTVHQDVAVTLFDLYGLAAPDDVSGTIVGTAPPDRVVRGMNFWSDPGPFWTTVGPQLSIVFEGRQLLYDWWGDRHLYDLSEDPTGLIDRYDPTSADVLAAWERMTPFVDEVSAAWPHLDPPTAPGP